MWNETTRKRLYAQFRTAGYSPVESWRSAGIVAEFRAIDGRMRSREELERELEHQLETFGVWGTIGEVWDGSEWIQADSVWGHAGYNNPDCPIENPYVVDHMAECLKLRADIGEDVAALP